jgi:hypothetical protein
MKQIPNSIVFIDSRKGKFMIEETETENDSGAWKKFLKKHWTMFALFVVAVILAAAGAVYVFLWFVGDAQSTGMVPSTLGLWTMETMVTFVLHAIFWELLLIGFPAILAGVAGWLWLRRLPSDEKKEYHFFGKRSRTTSGGGGISFLFFIAFCIKVFIDGTWNVAIANWTFDYVVDSMIAILIWSLIIFGIPIALGVIWWIRHEMKKEP